MFINEVHIWPARLRLSRLAADPPGLPLAVVAVFGGEAADSMFMLIPSLH